MVHVNGQRGKDQQELLAVDLDGAQGVERMVRYERNARVLRLDERERVLIPHQAVDGEAGRVAHHQPSVRYHVEALGGSGEQDVPQPLVASFRTRNLKQDHLNSGEKTSRCRMGTMWMDAARFFTCRFTATQRQ